MSRRRYFVRRGAEEVPLEVERRSGDEFRVQLPGGGEPVAVSVLGRGAATALLVDGKPVEVRHLGGGTVALHPSREELGVASRPSGNVGRDRGVEGSRVIAAPMPGRVVKVLTRVGASVAPGDALVVIEAMKMENELTAPRAGVVKHVLVEAGATVERNVPLVELE